MQIISVISFLQNRLKTEELAEKSLRIPEIVRIQREAFQKVIKK